MSANIKFHEYSRKLEVVKWLTVLSLLLLVVVSNYFYRDYNLFLRALFFVLILAIAGGLSMTTRKGRSVIIFAREAQVEVRKVIWPTRQETLHTTLIVALVTTIMSLTLWGLDGILVYIVSFITSLRL